jgi:outer membrane scaffolding protein for murein synthesis (MipA/OmpV family)
VRLARALRPAGLARLGVVVLACVGAQAPAGPLLPDSTAVPEHSTATPEPEPLRTAAGLHDRPLWEAGLGLATLEQADYRGSAQRRTLLLPLPYLVYRGQWLRADREGARAVLLDTRAVEVDVSVGGTAPAASEDNPLRSGMADLPATVEIGPNLNLTLWQSTGHRAKLDLRLPLRAVLTVQRSPRTIGQVFEPTLNLDLGGLGRPGAGRHDSGWNVGLQAGLLYGSQRYHQHFYGVATGEASADRPAYRAPSGYAGWKTLASLSRRVGDLWLGAFLRRDDLHGAVFADSPLVERRSQWSGGLGLSWVFATSSQLVRLPD